LFIDDNDTKTDKTAEETASTEDPAEDTAVEHPQDAPPDGQITADEDAGRPDSDQPEPDEGAKSNDRKADVAASRARRTARPWEGEERRSPTQKDVLERLLEKNEVILQLTRKTVELQATVKDVEERRMRGAAEFENYRKRTRKEWDLLKNQTKAEVLLDILNVVDDFDRALLALGDRDDDFVQGIRLIYNNLMSTLHRFGVTKMDAANEVFDPTFHMAVAQIDTKEAKANRIVEVIQEGYMLGDTVMRAAKVVIAK
jgi:molecular chaperone GrpE